MYKHLTANLEDHQSWLARFVCLYTIDAGEAFLEWLHTTHIEIDFDEAGIRTDFEYYHNNHQFYAGNAMWVDIILNSPQADMLLKLSWHNVGTSIVQDSNMSYNLRRQLWEAGLIDDTKRQ